MSIRLVCWDLDGTLTDSVRFVVDCANEIIGRHGGRILPFDEIGERTGLSLEELFRLAFETPTDEFLVTCRDEYRAHYDEVMIPVTALYPGAEPTLRAIREAKVMQATVTGKRARDGERILRMLGVGDYFDLFLGGDSVAVGKPAPDLALEAMRRLDVTPDQTLIVGDTRIDIEMARAARAHACLVLWGVAKGPSGGEDYVARTFDDVRRIAVAAM
ncbi:MAG: HAD family hydrolase [Chloroflexi bacterium]|nr:MAG: HAD family hydrolase [Chloroflexota bacterium]